jgi:hypothetical protein
MGITLAAGASLDNALTRDFTQTHCANSRFVCVHPQSQHSTSQDPHASVVVPRGPQA